MTTGYSGTPLAKKLGIKTGNSIYLCNQPRHYFGLFADFPSDVVFLETLEANSADFIHAFFTAAVKMNEELPQLKKALKKTGMLWVSWPKGSSTIATDLKREPVREFLLSLGLVDVKVAAIDADWSGLKFVYRLKDR